MIVGMLWYDNDPKKDVSSRILEAAEYYFKKYGTRAKRVEVNKKVFSKDLKVEGIAIIVSKYMPQGHYLIGE